MAIHRYRFALHGGLVPWWISPWRLEPPILWTPFNDGSRLSNPEVPQTVDASQLSIRTSPCHFRAGRFGNFDILF